MGEIKIRWSDLSAYTRTRFPGVVTLLPVLGYAVLFSDQLNSWFFNYGDFLQGGWLSPKTRILLVFVGAVLLAVGRLLFFACPKSIRQFAAIDGYVSHYGSHADRSEMRFSLQRIKKKYPNLSYNTVPEEDRFMGSQDYRKVVQSWKELSSGGDSWANDSSVGARATVLRAGYELMDCPSDLVDRVLKWACFAFYAVGTLVFLTPSFEVTLLALGQVVDLLLGVFFIT